MSTQLIKPDNLAEMYVLKCLNTLVSSIDRLAQLVEHRTAVREVAGSNLDRTNSQGLKITEEKVLPL